MSDLMQLVLAERAEALHLHAGRPPVIDLNAVPHTIEGPKLTRQDIKRCLREIASSRHVRELRDRGRLDLIYLFQGKVAFRVEAHIDEHDFRMDLNQLAS
jgi:Tfp pilus assembly pilus retraction ATPase PilT